MEHRKAKKIHAFEQDAIKSLEESIKTTIDSFGERFFKLRWLGAKNTPPQTPPLASTQQTSKIKGLGESKFHRNFVLFLLIFALNLMDFQRFFYGFS